MNLTYCNTQCPIGMKARKDFLNDNNSVCDAASDFWAFTEECFKTCSYKDKHLEED